ncbi:hypothetical protein PPYR_03297 [Photinus pyralis]|uniref:Uncharacterized protein n=1 Tax=Photinus pyralis TaxID=7054 RepID=A0A5N4A2F3_PHOPY|nr:uncharacterized protein LOC116161056 [Photinus pyralis]KAB0791497.1 hypothetical protein PPYR_03297 [Photinus pyralis]
MNPRLNMINDELVAFLQFCKKSKLSDEEVAVITRPLTRALARNKIKRGILHLLILLLLSLAVYYVSTTEIVSWHLSAIGRVGLINLLPIWNWRHLKYEKCLIPTKTDDVPIPLACELCEINNYIDSAYDIDPERLDDLYIKLHKALILNKAMTPNWYLPEIDTEPLFHGSTPCKLSTNVRTGTPTVKTLVDKLDDFERYFLHFQNCDFEAVKAFRRYAPKPAVLPARLSPTKYSWLLMSRDYNVTNYKTVQLVEPIALVGQMVGSNYFSLRPRMNCEEHCPVIEVALEEGEVLLLSSMYDLFYRPFPEGENVAVILEMH